MPHSFGYRARTRDLFSKAFRKTGTLPTQKFLQTYRLGDIVDVVGDGAVQKGMPHKFYHGKTGIVWNVTQRAVGVMLNKMVGNRIIQKKIHVRIEHVQHSKCRKSFLDRVQANDKKRAEAKKAGKHVVLKRVPKQPRKAAYIKNPEIETLYPIKYTNIYQ
eukprot:TRINITY_DN65905_c11_g8_i1.p2 TRINITY_DN65905_c11_g8~~TRINITY_DN65905_c11_g8_i1.p2  ORF type:complete len:176 (+),score=114.32 TRINITY_DN65905_c11_g8_i1:49-528(+)